MHPAIMEIRANMLDLLVYLKKMGNIDDDVSQLKDRVDGITAKKNNLKSILTRREYEDSSKYFDTITKQIKNKIDSLIGGKLYEQKRIAGELKSISNKRKLSKYSR
ncbi:MAG: hypothetical protein KKF62_01170 [Bacteroidetes bacterium]|nr:hypothetical protein [Bacteroidota bacterium]MBU1115174.1 hypothetical protein [Bacteroidota bacterium]MBU1799345.1 hypothetical protein [Bacteroidota bacterium]